MVDLIVDSQKSPKQPSRTETEQSHQRRSTSHPASFPYAKKGFFARRSASQQHSTNQHTPSTSHPIERFARRSSPRQYSTNLPASSQRPPKERSLARRSSPREHFVGSRSFTKERVVSGPASSQESSVTGPSRFSDAVNRDTPNTSTNPKNPKKSLHSPDSIPNAHGDEAQKPVQQQEKVAPQPKTDKDAQKARALSSDQQWRRRNLESEAYPPKLIQELKKIPGRTTLVRNQNLVYGVIHVNNSARNGLTIEHVGSYNNIQAANERVMDLWFRKYGTQMFTENRRRIAKAKAMSLESKNTQSKNTETKSTEPENTESIDGRSEYTAEPRRKGWSSGGVPENDSEWKFENGRLSLKHKDHKGEKKIHVVISYIREHGIHV